MGEELDSLEQSLLRHLLTYRGHQVRFEADAHTTEFGIYRAFTDLESGVLKGALRQLEAGRWIYRRVQYVIGFSEPKLVYSLTPHGYRKAVDLFGPGGQALAPPEATRALAQPNGPAPTDSPGLASVADAPTSDLPDSDPDPSTSSQASGGRRRERASPRPKNE